MMSGKITITGFTRGKLLEDFFTYSKSKMSNRVISYIYFYPWSKVEAGNVTYYNSIDKFLADVSNWGLEISPYQLQELYTNKLNYCSCIPNSPSVLVRHTFNDLKESIGKYVPGIY